MNTVWFLDTEKSQHYIHVLEYSVFQPKIAFILGKSGLVDSLKQILLFDCTSL